MKNRPVLSRWVTDEYKAFSTLSTSRPQGMGGAGYIPVSEMLAYCQMAGIRLIAERERFMRLMQGMDRVFMDFLKEKREKEAAQKKVAPGKVGRRPSRRGRR